MRRGKRELNVSTRTCNDENGSDMESRRQTEIVREIFQKELIRKKRDH